MGVPVNPSLSRTRARARAAAAASISEISLTFPAAEIRAESPRRVAKRSDGR